MAHYNHANVGELISDEPLDLSMKKSRHEMEYIRGPLVAQPNTLQQSNVVVARLWQTSVVIRSQESTQKVQRFEEAKENPIPKAQPKKRFRFNHYQIGIMERIFEIKKFPTSAEIMETARLLNAMEYQVCDSIYIYSLWK